MDTGEAGSRPPGRGGAPRSPDRRLGDRMVGGRAGMAQPGAVRQDRPDLRGRSVLLPVRPAGLPPRGGLGYPAGGGVGFGLAGLPLPSGRHPAGPEPVPPGVEGGEGPSVRVAGRAGDPQGGRLPARRLRASLLDPRRHLRRLLHRCHRPSPRPVPADGHLHAGCGPAPVEHTAGGLAASGGRRRPVADRVGGSGRCHSGGHRAFPRPAQPVQSGTSLHRASHRVHARRLRDG